MSHKVLLVDDEPNILTALKRALRKEPYEVITAGSAKEALALLDECYVDVIVSDHDMPGMNGTQFLSMVSKSYPEIVRFILTGKATLDMAIEAINEGAISRFLTKPCNEVDLAVTIRQALQQKDLMAGARRLLRKVKQQSAFLELLERESPGITQVDRDARGNIIIDANNIDANIPEDTCQFMVALQEEVDKSGIFPKIR